MTDILHRDRCPGDQVQNYTVKKTDEEETSSPVFLWIFKVFSCRTRIFKVVSKAKIKKNYNRIPANRTTRAAIQAATQGVYRREKTSSPAAVREVIAAVTPPSVL